jgi:hypothetical protein
MSKKFLISEDERRDILSMYGILKESIDPTKGGTQEFRVNYKAGWYDANNPSAYLDGQNKLIDEIDNFVKTQLIPYLQKVPSSVVAMKFRSGESLVPNTDNEGKDKGKGQPLEPGRLSELRKYYLEQYLNTVVIPQIQNVDKQAEIPELQYEKVEPKEPWIGKSWCKNPTDKEGRSCLKAWKDSGYIDRDKYNLDQVSEFSITVTPKTPTKKVEDCPSTIRIRFEIKNHSCQNAEFFVFANKTRLNNMEGGMTANLNTGSGGRGIPGVKDQPIFPKELMNPGYGILSRKYKSPPKGQTKEQNDALFSKATRWDDFEITPSIKEEILSQSINDKNTTPFINIWFECTTYDAHDDIVTITIYDGNNKVVGKPFSPNGKNEGLLCTLDKCGIPIKTINGSIGPSEGDVSSARQELINYKSSLMNSLGLSADTTNLDTKGLELEKAGSLLTNINTVLKSFDDAFKSIKSEFGKYNKEFNKLDETTRKFIMSQGDSFNFVRNQKIEYFQKVLNSNGYKSLLRKDPLDPNSYKRGLVTSDMGGDLKVRLDKFYNYFNKFYKIGDDEKIRPISLVSPEKYINLNNELNKIREQS